MPAGPCTGALRRKLPTGHPSEAGTAGAQVLFRCSMHRDPWVLPAACPTPRGHPAKSSGRVQGPPVGSVSTSTLLRHSETAHLAPPAGNPPSPTPIPSRRFRSGAAFGVRGRAESLGRCGRSGRARPGRAARPITAIRAAGRAVCHPKGRSVAEDVRSTLTRRPSRSYAAPTSRQACRASRGRVRTKEVRPRRHQRPLDAGARLRFVAAKGKLSPVV